MRTADGGRFADGHLGELLSAYLDGEITGGERSVIVSHIDSCDLCRAELSALSAVRASVRGLPFLELPTSLERTPKASARVRDMVPVYRRWQAWIGVAATVAAMVVGGSMITPQEPTSLSPQDLSAPFVARSSVEVGLAPMKVVVPPAAMAAGQP